MIRSIDPLQSHRAQSWKLYHQAPMPMVTIFKTLDITSLMKWKEQGFRLNMLLCYCILQAASKIKEFYYLPSKDTMLVYEQLGINVILKNKEGKLSTCDLAYTSDVNAFSKDYQMNTRQVMETCKDRELKDCMIIGTSSLVQYDIDGVVNMYSGIYNNPFLIWGQAHKERERTRLKVSFQFHHVQMGGLEACAFLEELQKQIDLMSMR